MDVHLTSRIWWVDDLYGKEGLEDGAEPMTKERAMRIFQDFFRFGEAMDPDAPEVSKGVKRAAGGVVYAPMKGLLYGGKSVLSGVVMGSAAVVVGAGAMVANVAMGVKEMGEAGVNAARKKKTNRNSTSGGEESGDGSAPDGNESLSHAGSIEPLTERLLCCCCSYLDRWRKREADANVLGGSQEGDGRCRRCPRSGTFFLSLSRMEARLMIGGMCVLQGLVTGGGVLIASGVAAGGYVVGGFAGAATNVASGVREVKAANRMEKQRQSEKALVEDEKRRLSQAAEDEAAAAKAEDEAATAKAEAAKAEKLAEPAVPSDAKVAAAPSAPIAA
jgi:hypothetical protein